MRMLNDCLEVTAAKRAELMAFDSGHRDHEYKSRVKEITKSRPSIYGNRKERRAAKAIQRRKEHV